MAGLSTTATFSSTKLLALLALLFALNLPRLTLQCGLEEIDCSFESQNRCCDSNAQCAMGTTSSGCCGTIQGQTAFCCENNSTCLCGYAPAQQCCGAPGAGFVCGTENECCGSVQEGTAKCCGPTQFCDAATATCVNQPIPANQTSVCPAQESVCDGGVNGNVNTQCCQATQTCVAQSVKSATMDVACCDSRMVGENETAVCCHNSVVGCMCTYLPSQQCCGAAEGFVCNANDTCCGSILEGTNKCCPFGTVCNPTDDSCVPADNTNNSSSGSGSASDSTSEDPVRTHQDNQEDTSDAVAIRGWSQLFVAIFACLAMLAMKNL